MNGETEKTFSTLQARYALAGYCLHRSIASNGLASYFVESGGNVLHLATLTAVSDLLNQIRATRTA